jgi:MFS family permease
VQLSFLMAADRLDDPVVQSWVVAAASIGSVLGSLVFMQIKPRVSERTSLMLVIGSMAAGLSLMPLTTSPVLLAIGAAFNGAGGGMASPHFTAILIERAPVAARGRAIGLLFTMQYVGSFANPFVVTPLVGLLGIHGAFFAVSALLVAGVVMAGLRRGNDNSHREVTFDAS